MFSVRDLADQVFDLVYYGKFTYADVLKMPVFERRYMHERTLKAYEQEMKFQLALHDKKGQA